MDINFDQVERPQKIDIEVDGWVYPLEVEYGLFKISFQTFLVWRVTGTKHIFRVPLKDVTAQHGSRYSEHFVLALKQFREDLMIWNQLGLPEVWMRDYYKQFMSFVV